MLNSPSEKLSSTDPTTAIDNLLSALDRVEAMQSLELQRLRLMIDRSVGIPSLAATNMRQPDMVIRLPRAA